MDFMDYNEPEILTDYEHDVYEQVPEEANLYYDDYEEFLRTNMDSFENMHVCVHGTLSSIGQDLGILIGSCILFRIVTQSGKAILI